MECPFCGSKKITNGELTTIYGLSFKADSSKLFNTKESPVAVKACLNCGKLFDFKIKNIEKVGKRFRI